MKLLTKERFDDSQHFWYQINLLQESNFGAVFDHDNKNIPQVVATIVDDLQRFRKFELFLVFWQYY